MKKVRTSSEMSSGIRKGNKRVSSIDPSKKPIKNPLLGKPVKDDDDIMIKF